MWRRVPVPPAGCRVGRLLPLGAHRPCATHPLGALPCTGRRAVRPGSGGRREGPHDRAGGTCNAGPGRRRREGAVTTMRLREMDERVTYRQQLEADDGPVVLINQFTVAPEDAERFLAA